ncbi:MAG: twin transmembrane helix small protein [Methylococcales bacterium]|nr:twin transmembrane helix small protein [Methylococcales bacterium]
MPIKIIFIILFIIIIFSLGSALFHLVKRKDQEQSEKTAKALTIRIGLSLVLFVMIFIAYATGMIKPEGIGARMQMMKQNQLQSQENKKLP